MPGDEQTHDAAPRATTTSLALGLLGPLEVVVDGSRVSLAGRNQRAVLALLALHAGRPVSLERMVDALWGEDPPRTASASAQNALSRLRRLLGVDRLRTTAAGYVLVVSEDEIDASQFERLVNRSSEQAEPADRVRLLEEALALWRGPPLAELEHESFVQGEIRRLEERRLVAVEERLDALIAAGAHHDLVAELQVLVDRNPLRERPRGMLMLALYRSGRQAEALRAFHDARTTFLQELGIEPGPELRELHAAILRQDHRLRPAERAEDLDDHLARVARALLAGRLVPVLGPYVHETDGERWRSGATRPPTTDQLAVHLAERFGVADGGRLARVSEVAAAIDGVGALHDELDAIFRLANQPGPVERFVARLPALLRAAGRPNPLVVTTTLDSALERAFADAGEEVDVVAYVAAGAHRGRFAHVGPDGAVTSIAEPNAYTGLSLDERSIVLRAHGRVDPSPMRLNESFVVSEDDHIDYLLGAEPGAAVPATVAARLRRSHILFVGYDVDDWSVRVFVRRIWGADRIGYRSWAIGSRVDRVARELWAQRDVDVVECEPARYVELLEERVHALGPAGQP